MFSLSRYVCSRFIWGINCVVLGPIGTCRRALVEESSICDICKHLIGLL